MTDTPLALQLRQIRLEARSVASYEFVNASGAPLPPFTAGAHIDLHLPGPLVRSYSLANDPAETHRYVLAVQREPQSRGGSAWLHTTARVGDVLRASAPINHFALHEEAAYSLLIAGGIGITPLMAMIGRLQRIGRPWRLVYAARCRPGAAFVDALSQLPGADVQLCFGDTRQARLDLRAIVQGAPADAHLYCCGPARMIDDFLQACADRPASQVHVERFSAAQAPASEGGFEVQLARDGRCFQVPPGKTILETLLDHGVDVMYACGAGVCGTCQTGLRDGEADHRDDYLTDEEKRGGRSIIVCCSGARSRRLVLDL